MSVITTESKRSLLLGIRQQVETVSGAFESGVARIAAIAGDSSHAALHVLADTPTKVASALRDPYSNVFLFTKEGNPIQISGRPGSRPFFTATDFANIFSNQLKPRK